MTNPRSRALTAVVSGLATAVYYALPDVVPSRAARGWLKAACAGVAVAAALPDAREGWAELRAARRGGASDDGPSLEGTVLDGVPDGTAVAGVAPAGDDLDADGPTGSATRLLAIGAAGAVALAGSVAATVAFERWLFARGQARAAAGVRFAHTRTGLVMGALTVATALIPDPSERD